MYDYAQLLVFGTEEYQEAVTEPLGGEELGSVHIAGAFAALGQKLASAAVAVAEGFVAADDGYKQRYQEINHAKPGKEDIEKSQSEVKNRPDPKKIMPMLLFHLASLLSVIVMHPAGQALAHRPQPTHFSSST